MGNISFPFFFIWSESDDHGGEKGWADGSAERRSEYKCIKDIQFNWNFVIVIILALFIVA